MDPNSLTRLTEITKTLNKEQDIETFVQQMVWAAAKMTRAEGCSFLLFDEVEEALFYAGSTWHQADPVVRARVENLEISLTTGVSGWVFKSQSTLLAEKKGKDPLLHPMIEANLPNNIQSVAAVPVDFHSRPIGVLECFNHAGGRFSNSDIEILETLAAMAGIMIYNAHLANKVHGESNGRADLERMQSDFIAIASHELRTPLGVIIGHTAVLQEIADGQVNEQLEVIARNARQLNEIIENLTAIQEISSGGGALRQQVVSVNALVSQCSRDLQIEAIEKGVRLIEKLPLEDVAAEADPGKLSLVFNNLVRNGIAFTANRPRAKVEIRVRRVGNFVEIAVLDNGIGISEADQALIFNRFYQVESHLRRKHGGMGVGLTTAKYLVEALGGKIGVKSVQGKGSLFTITLPAARPQTPVRALLDD